MVWKSLRKVIVKLLYNPAVYFWIYIYVKGMEIGFTKECLHSHIDGSTSRSSKDTEKPTCSSANKGMKM